MPYPASLNPLIALLVERCWNCWNIINNSAKYYFKNLHAAIAAAAEAAEAAKAPNPKAKARTKHSATSTQCRGGVPKASRSQCCGAADVRMWRQHGCEAFQAHTRTHTHALVTCILNNRRTTWGKERRMENRSKCRSRKNEGGSTSTGFLHCAAAVNLFRLRLCLPPGCVLCEWLNPFEFCRISSAGCEQNLTLIEGCTEWAKGL